MKNLLGVGILGIALLAATRCCPQPTVIPTSTTLCEPISVDLEGADYLPGMDSYPGVWVAPDGTTIGFARYEDSQIIYSGFGCVPPAEINH